MQDRVLRIFIVLVDRTRKTQVFLEKSRACQSARLEYFEYDVALRTVLGRTCISRGPLASYKREVTTSCSGLSTVANTSTR